MWAQGDSLRMRLNRLHHMIWEDTIIVWFCVQKQGYNVSMHDTVL